MTDDPTCNDHWEKPPHVTVDRDGPYVVTVAMCSGFNVNHECDCEFCDESGKAEPCRRFIFWRVTDPTGEIRASGEGKFPGLDSLIDGGRVLPKTAWRLLPGLEPEESEAPVTP